MSTQMLIPKTKAQIISLVGRSRAYCEDMQFIEETINDKNVFIGQFISQTNQGADVNVCHTVGMYMHDLPELVFTGVPETVVTQIVNSLTQACDLDREFLRGERSKKIFNFNVIAVPIENADSIHELVSTPV